MWWEGVLAGKLVRLIIARLLYGESIRIKPLISHALICQLAVSTVPADHGWVEQDRIVSALFDLSWKLAGAFTALCVVVTLFAFVTKQQWRFRAFGITAFMTLLTVGFLTLAILPSPVRERIPGATSYQVVFDRGGNRAVIAVKPTITAEALGATLQQAAVELSSPGRSITGNSFTIQARTVVHPQPGLTRVLYVGTLERPIPAEGRKPIIRIDPGALQTAQQIAKQTAEPVK